MKLNTKRTCLVGLAFLSICAFWNLYDFVIPLVLKNTYHLGDTWSGVVMAMDNILALFLLPVFGALSDKANTRIGRRMPFILGGTAAAAALMLALPIVIRDGTLPVFLGLPGTAAGGHGHLSLPGGGADAGRDSQATALQGQRHH